MDIRTNLRLSRFSYSFFLNFCLVAFQLFARVDSLTLIANVCMEMKKVWKTCVLMNYLHKISICPMRKKSFLESKNQSYEHFIRIKAQHDLTIFHNPKQNFIHNFQGLSMQRWQCPWKLILIKYKLNINVFVSSNCLVSMRKWLALFFFKISGEPHRIKHF